MKRIFLPAFLVLTLVVNFHPSYGQNESSSKVVFLNAPVLFKEGGKTFQQIVAGYKSDTLGEISFAI